MSPTSARAGGSAFTLTVNGSNFVAGSVVRWNGSGRPTAFVSSGQVTAQILAGDIAAAGMAQVTVFNPAPGGGTSNALTFTISSGGSSGFSLRFHGNGINDIDRVKILIHNTPMPDPPANVGATDFTLEFWMKANAVENTAGPQPCGQNINWIFGNIVFDRDRFNQDRKFGLSIGGGRFIFGVSGEGTGQGISRFAIQSGEGTCWITSGTTLLFSALWMAECALFVDGMLQAQALGPMGDISYPTNGVPLPRCGPTGTDPCTNSDPYLVIGAEKHDAGSQFPSFSGWVTEVRLSTTLRYLANFLRPTQRFTPDGNTVALYHFAEGAGDVINDTSGFPGGPSNGMRKFGGTLPIPGQGPEWVTDTPFP